MEPTRLPPYEQFPVIELEELILREVMPTDVDEITEISFYEGRQASSPGEAMEMLGQINEDYLNGECIHWGIADKKNNIIIGTCGFYRGFENNEAEAGCIMRPGYRGTGVMVDVFKALIHFAFSTMGLQQINAITTKENVNAVKLLEKLHFMEVKEDEDEYVHFALKK